MVGENYYQREFNPKLRLYASREELLGIDPSWSKEEIKEHLLKEFSKYSGRLNTVLEGRQRENAQNMIDKISEAREKYS